MIYNSDKVILLIIILSTSNNNHLIHALIANFTFRNRQALHLDRQWGGDHNVWSPVRWRSNTRAGSKLKFSYKFDTYANHLHTFLLSLFQQKPPASEPYTFSSHFRSILALKVVIRGSDYRLLLL